MMRQLIAVVALIVGATPFVAAEDAELTWSFKSAKANDAVRKYRAACKKLDEALDKNFAANREALIQKLQQQVKTATTANKLDDAIALRDAIRILKNGEATSENKNGASAKTVAPRASAKPKAESRAVYLVSSNYPDRLIADDLTLSTSKENGAFYLRPGLSGKGSVSLESVRLPGQFLVLNDLSDLVLQEIGEDANQRKRASFMKRAGIANRQLVSFESVAQPGYFILHQFFRMRVLRIDASPVSRMNATFSLMEVPRK